MRKLPLVLLFAGACATVSLLYAQTLPTTKHLTWSQPDAVTNDVTGYRVQVNQAAPVTFGPCAPDPTVCDVTVTITALGPLTVTETPFTIWGDGPTTTLLKTVVVPGRSNNVQIK
jgi:hypothetical protein